MLWISRKSRCWPTEIKIWPAVDYHWLDWQYFKRGVTHATPEIHSEPVVFFAIDTPRRDPKDIVFVTAEYGMPESFIRPFAN